MNLQRLSENDSSLTEDQMIARFRAGEVKIPPLRIKLIEREPRRGSPAPDAELELTWGGERQGQRFAAEFKARSTPKNLQGAIEQATAYAAKLGLMPLVVLPYLSPAQLQELEAQGVSGLDLCGNAIIWAPKSLYVYRTGAPNLFPDSSPIKDIYRGNTSLVPRALLLKPESESLADLASFIETKGGRVTLTTISKALRSMEQDVLITRQGGQARLLQADMLLQRLARSYRAPRISRKLKGRFLKERAVLPQGVPLNQFWARTTKAVLAGTSSVSRYAVMGRESQTRFYCESLPELVLALGDTFQVTERYADVELLETPDTTVYFDVRAEAGMPYASPVQVFLELAQGDKREQETAEQVRDYILKTRV